jgi:transposase-like protein
MSKSKIKKKPHSAEFKFKVAIAALKGDMTVAELCQNFSIVSSQIYKWKNALLASGATVFKEGTVAISDQNNHKELDMLHATIGRLKVENDFLSKALGK